MKTSPFFFLYVCVLLVLSAGCKKDKFTTEPQIKIKSVSPEEVRQGNIIQVKGSFTDDEGDLDSALVVQKYFIGDAASKIDTSRYGLDALGLPKDLRNGDFTIAFAYGQFIDGYVFLNGSPVARDTTAAFGLVMKDKEGHRSNYEESAKIRLFKP